MTNFFLFIITIGITLVACDNKNNSASPVVPTYSVSMHLHGHSNHNGANKPASMQWVSHQAHLHQVADVLWWNDHTDFFDQTTDLTLALNIAVLNGNNLDIPYYQNNPSMISRLTATLSPPTAPSSVNFTQNVLNYSVTGASNTQWSSFEYLLQGSSGRIQGFKLPRPVSSGPQINLVWVTAPPTNDKFYEVEVSLAWHHGTNEVQHTLIYELSTFPQAPYNRSEGVTIIPLTYRADGVYSLDLLGGTSLLMDGDDNTISEIKLRMGARLGQTATASLSTFSIHSTLPSSSNQVAQTKLLSQRYENRYNQSQHIGVEYGGSTFHLNGFFDDNQLITPLLTKATNNDTLSPWVQLVHEKGGIVSMNHMFGTTSGYHNLNDPITRKAQVDTISKYLLVNRAFSADMIEVGYLARGGADLQDHLAVWDIMTSNNIILTGIGVTDTHGGNWSENMLPNPFTTWIQAQSPRAHDLISALRKRKAFFGNPFLWNGQLQFSVGDHDMGTISPPVNAKTLPVSYQISPFIQDMHVYLVQGLIKPGKPITYLHNRTLLQHSGALTVNISQPCFIRLEFYSGSHPYFPEGTPVMFSNPVFFIQ